MKNIELYLLIALGIIVIVGAISLIVYSSKPIKDGNSCLVDSDCMTNSCCHPSGCMLKQDRVCTLLCTDVCSGPLDCGKGSCGCVNGECAIKSN